jgi:hypothetical protein
LIDCFAACSVIMYLAYKFIKRKRAEKAAAAHAAQVDPAEATTVDDEIKEHQDGGSVVVPSNEKQPEAPAPNPPTAVDPTEPEETPEEKRARRIYRWKLVIALFPAAFLASVDLTVVATALTTIASHFGMCCDDLTGYTNNQRRVEPVQLDRDSLHSHLHGVHTRLWPDIRHVWSAYGPSNLHVLYAYWIHALRRCSELDNAVVWPSTPRLECSGHHEHHQDHLS